MIVKIAGKDEVREKGQNQDAEAEISRQQEEITRLFKGKFTSSFVDDLCGVIIVAE